jgi:GT2 family glycosyltransferase
VGAKLFYPDKKIQHFGVAMSAKHGNMPWHVYTGMNDCKFTKQNKQFQAVTGACMLIRYSCIKELINSKLNEDYNWSFDDIDLCLQVSKNQKKKIVCCAKTNIIHHESASLKKNPVNKIFLQQNANIFLSNWYGKYDIDYDRYMKDASYNLYMNKTL